MDMPSWLLSPVKASSSCMDGVSRARAPVPPDHTRLNSYAGPITAMLYEMLTKKGAHVDVIPALGTHAAMGESELRMMFGDAIPMSAFRVHDWRNDVVEIGTVPSELVKEWSGAFQEVSEHRILIKSGPGNRSLSASGTTHKATYRISP